MSTSFSGPQGNPGAAGHQGVVRCCSCCTHFYREPEGNQSGFYGTCPTEGVLMVLSHPEDAAMFRGDCSYFDPRPMEEIVAERLSGRWLGKWRA